MLVESGYKSLMNEWSFSRQIYYYRRQIKTMATQPVAIAMVFVCAVFTSFAQILFKFASFEFSLNVALLLTNHFLIAGMLLYAVAAALLIMAFKHGELSVIYPIIATSYIWVGILSWIIFSETMGIFKWIGIASIIVGITVIALGSKKKTVIDYVDVA